MGRFAEQKAKARKAVHAAFSYAATYQDNTLDAPVPVSVRWHSKMVVLGDFQDSGYASVIEGIQKIIFMRDELEAISYVKNGVELYGIVPRPHGVVTITEPGFGLPQFSLEVQEEFVGPLEEKWQVKRVS